MQFYQTRISLFSLVIVIALHLFALFCVCLLALAFILKLSLVIILICSAYYFVGNLFQPFSRHIKLGFGVDYPFAIQLQSGETVLVTVLPQSVVTRYLMVLYLKPIVNRTKKLKPLVLWFDSLLPEELRELRYQLRMQKSL